MAYQALYRQYRPACFRDMVGQEHIVQALRNQVASGRIGHAYLFCGSRGTGKTSAAKIFARAVNCLNPQDGDVCGECASCKRLAAAEVLDIIEMDAASNSKVEDARDLLETVKYPPNESRYKVYIIDEIHEFSDKAFNALLKTLEEPPEHAIFILATTDPQKLPNTILSRCQRYDFARIPVPQIVKRLRLVCDAAKREADDEALNHIARAAEGGMRDALSMLDMCMSYDGKVDTARVQEVLGTNDRAFLFRFAEAVEREDAAALLGAVDELIRDGRDPAIFAREVAQHMRALMMAKACPDELPGLLDVTQETANDYVRQAEDFSPTRLMSVMDLFMGAETALRYASSPRLYLETAALKACLRTGEEDTAALKDRIADLEKKLRGLQDALDAGQYVVAVQAPNTSAAKEPAKKAAKPARQDAAPVEIPREETASGKSSDAVWKELLDKVKRVQPGTFAFLSQGRFDGCAGGVYRWHPSSGSDSSVAYVMKAKELLEQLLTEISGAPSHFEAAAAAAPAASGVSQLQQFRDIFGAENVIEQ